MLPRRLRSAYEWFDSEPETILDMGSGIVFVVSRHSGRVRGAAGPVEGRYAWVIAAKQGLVVQVIAGSDISEARAAGERLAESKG